MCPQEIIYSVLCLCTTFILVENNYIQFTTIWPRNNNSFSRLLSLCKQWRCRILTNLKRKSEEASSCAPRRRRSNPLQSKEQHKLTRKKIGREQSERRIQTKYLEEGRWRCLKCHLMAGPMPEEVCVKHNAANSKTRVTAHTTMLNDQIRIGARQLSSAHSGQDCAILTPAVSPYFF